MIVEPRHGMHADAAHASETYFDGGPPPTAATSVFAWEWDFATDLVHRAGDPDALLGLPAEGTAASFLALVLPDDRAWLRPALARARHGETPHDFEYRLRLPDGRVARARERGRLLRDEAGRPARLLGTTSLLTADHERAGRLAVPDLRARAAFEQPVFGLALLDADGAWLEVNERLCGMLGLTRAELLRRGFARVATAEDAQAERDVVRALVAGEIARHDVERCWRCGDGETREVGLTLSLVHDAEGRPGSVIAVVADVSARQAAEAARREAEALAQGLMDGSPDCMKLLDRAGRLLQMNASGLRVMEIEDPRFLRGRPWISLWPERERAGLQRALDEAREGRVARFAAPCPTFKGSPRTWQVAVWPLRDAAGRLLVVSSDITVARAREAELRRQVELLEAVTASAADAIFVCDAEGRTTLVNPAAERLFGWRREELLGQPLHEALLDRDADGAAPPRRFVTGEAVASREEVLLRRDGSRIEVSCSSAPLHREGRSAGAVLVMHDITTRKQAEQALRASQERLRLALEATGLGTWDLNPRSGVLSWDARCKEIFGLAADAPVDYGVFIARLDPRDRKMADAAVARALDPAGPGTYEVEYRVLVPGGDEPSWVAAKGAAVFEEGLPVRFIGTVLDITARKRTEEHRRLLIHELNHRVKNTLATVQALASQTFHEDTVWLARAAFEDRLLALSRAQSLLTREFWSGASLQHLVSEIIAPYAAAPERFRVEGPPQRLSPNAALALAMALNELCTNAAKYGALTSAGGRVSITWEHRGDGGEAAPRLLLRWEETGGPPVTPPQRRGFGTRMIERGLARELRGKVLLQFPPAGVVCTIDVPAPRDAAFAGDA